MTQPMTSGGRRRPAASLRSASEPRLRLSPSFGPSSLMGTVEGALADPAHREYAVAGRVVLSIDGRPLRSIITGRRTLVTGAYASRKAGRAQVFESMVEHDFFMLCEVDPKVVDYRAQPFRFEFALAGRWRTYIADCARLMDDGVVEVIELKSDRRYLDDPDYRAKLEGVRQLCDLLGWRFSVVLRRHLDKCPIRKRNIELVQQDRLTAFDDGHIYQVVAALAEGPACVDDIVHALGCGPKGGAILRGMMVARIIEIDLVRPLSGESVVRLLRSGAGAGQ